MLPSVWVEGIVQLYVPAFKGVLVVIVRLTKKPLYSRIFTLDPGLPTDVQLMGIVLPLVKDSPPLGEMTVTEGLAMVKVLLLVSLIVLSVVLVILIL